MRNLHKCNLGVGCNVVSLNAVKELFGESQLKVPTIHIYTYSEKEMHNLGTKYPTTHWRKELQNYI